MIKYLKKQAELHPAMTPQDVYKLIYQAAFGAEHLLENVALAKNYFEKEYEALLPGEEPLYEQICDRLFRVNMRAWKQRGLDGEWLFGMFAGTMVSEFLPTESTGGRESFEQYVEDARQLATEGVFSFDGEAFEDYGEAYRNIGLRAVHHSETYRAAEKPAYRLVNKAYLRLVPILEALNKQAKETPTIIVIDGQCASGKTTMAAMLSEILGAGVIHMDDFFLPPQLRGEERLKEAGGNVHYERFAEEVLPRLSEGKAFAYRRFDCNVMELREERQVPSTGIYVVEGAYSCHPYFGDYADIKVFSKVDNDVQLERIARRDGETALQMFRERWIPMEENYFKTYNIMSFADVVVE